MTARLACRCWQALVLLIIALVIRAPTFGQVLLHLDENFYLLVGDHLAHQGLWPYLDIWDRKPIGLFALYGGISLLGGDGFLAYQLVAAAFVAATALVILQIAAVMTSRVAAFLAAIAYIAWINLFGGYGGQAPVFYNLLVAAAAWGLVSGLFADPVSSGEPKRIFRTGLVAMLLLGLAIQIKPTTGFEGLFFGLVLLWYSRKQPLTRFLLWGVAWVFAALLPTLAAVVTYWAIGGLDGFVFANLTSILRRTSSFTPASADRLLTLFAFTAPLILLSFLGLRRSSIASVRFVQGWSLVAVFAVLGFGTYYLHYGLPLALPLVISAAIGFDRLNVRRPIALGLMGLIVVAGSIIVVSKVERRGSRSDIAPVLELTRTTPGSCPYFTGSTAPTLYILSHSCLPSRFVISGHLFESHEAQAIGVDQRAELRRIIAGRPKLVTLETRPGTEESVATRRYFAQLLAEDYQLVSTQPVGRVRLSVYVRRAL